MSGTLGAYARPPEVGAAARRVGLAEPLREIICRWWLDRRHGRRRVALLPSFPALRRPRVDEEVRALDGGPLRHRACVLASWRRYALLVGLCLWAARVRACRVLLRCYALGSALWASRCLRRLPLAVIGCDALVSTACFAREQGAGQASRGLAPWPRPFDATRRRVRSQACLQPGPFISFSASVRVVAFQGLEAGAK